MGTLWPVAGPEPLGAGARDTGTGAAHRDVDKTPGADRHPRGAGTAPVVRPSPGPRRRAGERSGEVVGALLDAYLPGGVRPEARPEARGLRGRRPALGPGVGPPRPRGRPRDHEHERIPTGVN